MGTLRIAMVVPHFFTGFGGHEYYLSAELAATGHKVRIFTSDFMPVRYFRRPTRTYAGEEESKNGVMVERISAFVDIAGIPMFDPRGSLRDFAPDVITATEFYHPSSYMSFLGAERMGVPFVFAQHMYQPPMGIRGVVWKGLSSTVGSRIRRGSSKIVAISSAAKAMLVSLGVPPGKIAVVPLGVDTILFQPTDGVSKTRSQMGLEDTFLMLFVGRMEGVKGVRVLLRAFASLRASHPSVRLLLVGGGDELKAYEELVRRSGLSDSVRFTGAVRRDALPGYFNAADVFVMPSYKEPFGLVGLEAMACGKPVVASAVGGIPDFVTPESGLLVTPGSPGELARAVERLIEDPALRERLGRGARRIASERFSYKQVAAETAEILSELKPASP